MSGYDKDIEAIADTDRVDQEETTTLAEPLDIGERLIRSTSMIHLVIVLVSRTVDFHHSMEKVFSEQSLISSTSRTAIYTM